MTTSDDPLRGLPIGELARRTGASHRSLRYYEQRGLISARRDPNGYRRFDGDVVPVVLNVRRLLGAGLSIEDVRQFGSCLHAPDLGGHSCAPALAVHERRLRALDSLIARLRRRRDVLGERTDRLRRELDG